MTDNFKKPQPLQDRVPIVNPDGTPNPYFIKWAQERQSAIAGSVSPAEAAQIADDEIAAWSALRNITGGTALTEVPTGGALDADIVINHDNSAVTPGTYGNATHSAQITVDQQGHITDVVDVPISGGGGSGFSLIDSQTVIVTQPTIDFLTITQTFKDLVIEITGRGDTASTTTDIIANINSDTGANYDFENLQASNTSVSGVGIVGNNNYFVGRITASSAPADVPGSAQMEIPGYSATVFFKTLRSRSGNRSGSGSGNMFLTDIWGSWRNTAAVTQVTLALTAGNFDIGTTVSLYGRG